ncbi:MAG: helix-turn-helix transcriptional regulator [Hyphococcus sp.]
MMHPLKRYLQDVDETVQDFAQRVGASRQTLHRIIAGSQTPKPALARRIVEATGAAVGFETLYKAKGDSGEVIGLRTEEGAATPDQARLKVALAMVVHHLSTAGQAPPDSAIDVAAEAVLNTYVALAPVTTRQGPDRLQQALRPVLEEILKDFGGAASPAALDEGAALATRLYYHRP